MSFIETFRRWWCASHYEEQAPARPLPTFNKSMTCPAADVHEDSRTLHAITYIFNHPKGTVVCVCDICGHVWEAVPEVVDDTGGNDAR